MIKKAPFIVLIFLLSVIQVPLWVSKGGWLDVWDLQRQIDAQRDFNKNLEIRNYGLEAQVHDLKSGYKALEELARTELGMVGEGELFFRVTGDQRVFIVREN